ncbi:Uncharacterised protein [Enterobacter hormaechei]|nr:Uncharacterised protein [Enterobacter hormaechei]
MVRNVAPTIMLAIQLVAVEQVIPKSRPFSGWISEHSTQISGPALIANPMINISSIATAKYCAVEE